MKKLAIIYFDSHYQFIMNNDKLTLLMKEEIREQKLATAMLKACNEAFQRDKESGTHDNMNAFIDRLESLHDKSTQRYSSVLEVFEKLSNDLSSVPQEEIDFYQNRLRAIRNNTDAHAKREQFIRKLKNL